MGLFAASTSSRSFENPPTSVSGHRGLEKPTAHFNHQSETTRGATNLLAILGFVAEQTGAGLLVALRGSHIPTKSSARVEQPSGRAGYLPGGPRRRSHLPDHQPSHLGPIVEPEDTKVKDAGWPSCTTMDAQPGILASYEARTTSTSVLWSLCAT